MSEPTQWARPDLDIDAARKYLGLELVDELMINWHALINHPKYFRERHPKCFELMVNKMIRTPLKLITDRA